MDNATFERDQKNFFKKVEEGTEHVDQIPEMERFVKFWLDIQEEDDRTHELLWMESVSKKLRDKIANVKDSISKKKPLKKKLRKRKIGLRLEQMAHKSSGGRGENLQERN